jgi:hypothetical protein
MNPPGNGTEGTNQGNDMEEAPEIGPTDQPPQPLHQTGRKWSDQSIGSACAQKKKKAQNPQVIYTLMDDDMDRIGYKLRDVMEEFLEEMTKQQEALQMKVQDQCSRLQQLLETV